MTVTDTHVIGLLPGPLTENVKFSIFTHCLAGFLQFSPPNCEGEMILVAPGTGAP